MLGRLGLLAVPEAQAVLRKALQKTVLREDIVTLEEGLGRILSKDIAATENLPPHPRSTMDGFAVKSDDTFGASESMPCYLRITGEVLMGQMPAGELRAGDCFKVPTGGMIPEGADSVVMLEHTVPVDDTMIEVVKSVGSGTNIIRKGEDIAKGNTALQKGHKLRPQDIGLLAGLGLESVSVSSRIRVGILSTGDEIIPHTQVPAPGQIRNINSLAIGSQVKELGGIVTDYGIVSDEKNIFLQEIKKAVAENDMVLFSGGSSVGVRDLGEQIVEELGPPGILVHGVKLKPGKPILIGMSGDTPVFGLPGHPVSAMVCFDFFVRPALAQLQGQSTLQSSVRPKVTASLTRNMNSAPGRLDVIRVKLKQHNNGYLAEPVMGKSGSISTLSRADGFFLIDEDSQGVTENSAVEVYIFP